MNGYLINNGSNKPLIIAERLNTEKTKIHDEQLFKKIISYETQ